MGMKTSKVSGFYRKSLDERLEIVKEFAGLSDEDIEVLNPGEQILVDEPPSSNVTWHYRARCTAPGYDPSEYTSWYPLRPMILPDGIPLAPAEPLCDLDMFVDPASGEVSLYINATPRITHCLWNAELNQGTFPDAIAGRIDDLGDDPLVAVTSA